jgi:hypothetical protein
VGGCYPPNFRGLSHDVSGKAPAIVAKTPDKALATLDFGLSNQLEQKPMVQRVKGEPP